jgi:HEAT repeat protein
MSANPTQAPPGVDAPPDAADMVRWLDRLIRAARFYEPSNPGYLQTLAKAEAELARVVGDYVLKLTVTEHGFKLGDRLFPPVEGRDALHTRLYLDGIRSLTFEAGAERDLDALAMAIRTALIPPGDGDVLSALWRTDMEAISFDYVDPALVVGERDGDGGEAPMNLGLPSGISPVGAPPERLDARGAAEEGTAGGAAEDEALLSREDFEETLYFLDDQEIQALEAEIAEDFRLDMRLSVARGLLDRLEDEGDWRTAEIGAVLTDLVLADLVNGDLAVASLVASELDRSVKAGALSEEATRIANELLDRTSSPEVVDPLLDRVVTSLDAIPRESLVTLVSALRSSALSTLLAATTRMTLEQRAVLAPAIEALASSTPRTTVSLLASDDHDLARAAAALAGHLGLAEGQESAQVMLRSTDPAVRRAAVDYLVAIRSSTTITHILDLLRDPDQDVRLATVQGLGSVRYPPAAAVLERRIKERPFWRSSTREVSAVLQAYATIAGNKAVDLLRWVIFEKTFWLRRPPVEMRAAAARALGLIRTPAADEVLARAAKVKEAAIRNTARQALDRRKESV